MKSIKAPIDYLFLSDSLEGGRGDVPVSAFAYILLNVINFLFMFVKTFSPKKLLVPL